MAEPDDMVEVFKCTSLASAQMIIDEVLSPEGIPAVVHDRMSMMIPAPASMVGGFFIAVPAEAAAQAIDALREADEGDLIPDDGEIAEA
jgi:hypothetical protein